LGLAKGFKGESAPSLLLGLSAHAMVPLHKPTTAAFGVVLAMAAHAYGWPAVRGGTQGLADGLASRLRALGGVIETDRPITSLAELPPARAILCDTSPRGLLSIAADRLPGRYRRRLERFRYGPGVFKMDWALDGPVPWRAADVGRAGTVHLGGSVNDVLAAQREIAAGRHPERPFVLFVQSSRFDETRAPAGKHTGWAYCHVPNGSDVDMSERIEAQVERFAPGFRDLILARSIRGPATLEADNPNYVGGDINAGIQDWRQLFTRPVARLDPYTTPVRGLYLCSSSTPPGGGVHGMCGVWAARSALKREFGRRH
jgi:phytoene dehydrogenase-like protein